MNLIDRELDQKREKNTKTIKIIVAIICVLIIIGIGLVSYLTYLQSKQFKFLLNGKTQEISSDLFVFEDGKIYVSIKDLTNVLKQNSIKIEYDKGSYKEYNEDATKCNIKTDDEVAGYDANSEKMYKVVLTDDVYEYYTLDEPVKSINGKLYTSQQGIEIGFNMMFIHDEKSNSVKMYTLQTLAAQYEKKLNNTVINSKDMSFSNKKALKYDMIIVKNENNEYGVNRISTGESVLGTEYSNLKFIESTQDFIVTTPENKQGIRSTLGSKDIEPLYTEIKQLDKDLNLYLIKNDKGKYGVYNREKQTIIIYPEYDAIGIDEEQFKNDAIENPYILYDYCIPCKKVENNIEKWELININGEKITQQSYDSLGYIRGTSKTAKGNNLLLIPEIEGIVIYKDAMYGVINSTGKQVVKTELQQVYSETSAGENTYYMVYNGQTFNILEVLEKANNATKTNDNNVVNNTTSQSNNESNNTVISNSTNNTNAIQNKTVQ